MHLGWGACQWMLAHHRGVELPAIVTRRDLELRGLPPRAIREVLGAMTRLAPGTYAETTGLTLEQVHRLRTEAVLGRVTRVVVSHVSAANLWALPLLDAHLHTVHVSPSSQRVGRPKSGTGYRMHSLPVRADCIREVDGVSATEPLLTVLDCARLLDHDWGVAIADAALRADLITAADLRTAAAQLPRQPGVGRARRLHLKVSRLAESPGESLLRLRLQRMGLEVREQVWVGSARVDFLLGDRTVVEFDGRAKYTLHDDPAAAHWQEKRRDDALIERGYVVIHIAWADLWDERALRRRIHVALARLP